MQSWFLRSAINARRAIKRRMMTEPGPEPTATARDDLPSPLARRETKVCRGVVRPRCPTTAAFWPAIVGTGLAGFLQRGVSAGVSQDQLFGFAPCEPASPGEIAWLLDSRFPEMACPELDSGTNYRSRRRRDGDSLAGSS